MNKESTRENKVYKYYLLGLNNKEIAKLLEVSEKTIQRIIKNGNFKELSKPVSISEKAKELRKKGLTYTQISKALKRSKTSIYNYLHDK